MGKRDGFGKALAIAGTIFVWLPIVAPLTFGFVRFAQSGRLMVDYLMPGELFLAALVGGALLLWAALRARVYRALTAWALGVAGVAFAASMAAATLTGLASGAAEPLGWPLALVLGLLGAYTLALVVLGVDGILMLRALFRPQDTETPAAAE